MHALFPNRSFESLDKPSLIKSDLVAMLRVPSLVSLALAASVSIPTLASAAQSDHGANVCEPLMEQVYLSREFPYGDFDLSSRIDKIANKLKSDPCNYSVRIETQTDTIGSDADNMNVAQQWAAQMRSELERRGVASARISVSALGETPARSNLRDGVEDPLYRSATFEFTPGAAPPSRRGRNGTTASRSAGPVGGSTSSGLTGQPVEVPVREAIGREMANFAGQFAGLSVAAMKANGSYSMFESMAWLTGNTGQGIGSGEIDMMIEVDEVRCVSRPAPARAKSAALCRYQVRTRGMQRMYFPIAGQDFLVESLDSGWATRTDTFVESGEGWRSPDVAQSMVSSLARRQVSRTPNSDPNAGLCRALGAGVIATGGSSDSQRMYSTAGC